MLTKIFSALRHRRPLDRPTAWACLMANLLVLPGLGSCLAGLKTGLIQMLLALSGFVLTTIWAFWFVKTWIALQHLPTDIGPYFGHALLGLALFFLGWFWALASSIATLRKAKQERPE